MKRILKFISIARDKGLLSAVASGLRHLQSKHQEREIRRWYKNVRIWNEEFDQKYGVETTTHIDVDEIDVPEPNKAESNKYTGMPEPLFTKALAHLQIDHSQYCFVDFGSGKGKALLLASRHPFKKIIGVEFSNELCHISKDNVSAFRSPWQKTRAFEINCIDATLYPPPLEPAVFFFYNPFHGLLMQTVVDRLAASLREHPRPAWIVYCNPDCAEYFDAIDLFEPVASGRRYRVWQVNGKGTDQASGKAPTGKDTKLSVCPSQTQDANTAT